MVIFYQTLFIHIGWIVLMKDNYPRVDSVPTLVWRTILIRQIIPNLRVNRIEKGRARLIWDLTRRCICHWISSIEIRISQISHSHAKASKSRGRNAGDGQIETVWITNLPFKISLQRRKTSLSGIYGRKPQHGKVGLVLLLKVRSSNVWFQRNFVVFVRFSKKVLTFQIVKPVL